MNNLFKKINYIVLLSLCFVSPSWAAYALARFGEPKYPANFQHFDYVNPQAKKAGHLRLSSPGQTNFDKFNPFTVKGESAPGISSLMFETLAVSSLDERASLYGLLAEDMVIAPNQLSMVFRLNAKAHFNNGDPVLAKDVKHSFESLLKTGAYPGFAIQFADVAGVDVLDDKTVRFRFKQFNGELPYTIAGGLPIFSHRWGGGAAFDKIVWQPPITTGPYLIKKQKTGQFITYERDPRYWGSAHPTQQGLYNFHQVTYKLYKDDLVRLEAFKSGEFDVITEYRAKSWVKNYVGKPFDSGQLIKKNFEHRNGVGMQGFVMNLRRPMFADKRVRQALGLAFDFEWMNKMLFYGQYSRITSYFTNSEYAATGLPNTKELEILTPYQNLLPKAVFGPMPLPPNTNPPDTLRQNLRLALRLLNEAGWNYKDGALRNRQGEPFVIDFMDDGGGMGRLVAAYTRSLEKIGIELRLKVTDPALFERRRKSFDYDMISVAYGAANIPGNELSSRWGSQSATMEGSDNLVGVKNPVVDQLITRIIASKDLPNIINYTKALDRVLWNEYYLIPHYYNKTHRVAFQKNLSYHEPLPLYYGAEDWVLSTWWFK